MKDRHSEWVRVGQAARAAGVHPATIRRWAQQGRIRARQLGGRSTWWLIHLPSLLKEAAVDI